MLVVVGVRLRGPPVKILPYVNSSKAALAKQRGLTAFKELNE